MPRPDPTSGLSVVLTHAYAWPEVRRGGERYLHELASALTDAGHRVEVVASAPAAGRAVVLGVPVTYLRRHRLVPRRFGASDREVAFALAAGTRLAGRRIDVWHALGVPDAAVATALGRVRGFRSVYTVLGVPERAYMDGRPDRRFHDFAAGRVGEYVCLSEAAARAFEAGWGRRPAVVGGGVDCRRFAPPTARHPTPALLYSGSFDAPNKNVPLLIAAMGHLVGAVPGIELWLSGQGAAEALLADAPDAVRSAVRVLGVGDEDDQAGRYGRAWATVLPSENEAFGLCLVESLACGTPIVVLAGGGGPAEIVGPGIGAVAATKTPEALAAACREALELAAVAATTDACRATAEAHDWRKSVVPRLEAVYRG